MPIAGRAKISSSPTHTGASSAQDLFGGEQRHAFALHRVEDVGELVAPRVVEVVAGAQHLGAQDRGEALAHPVADRVAPGGVDARDQAEVDHQQAEARAVGAPRGKPRAQLVEDHRKSSRGSIWTLSLSSVRLMR
jgi:hypothetical protein